MLKAVKSIRLNKIAKSIFDRLEKPFGGYDPNVVVPLNMRKSSPEYHWDARFIGGHLVITPPKHF